MRDTNEIVDRLKGFSNKKSLSGMSRFGMDSDRALGVRIPDIRKFAKEIGKDHELARRLWDMKIRETMIVAGLVDVPDLVTEGQMEAWVSDFYDWEVCDQTIANLFEKTPFAREKAVEWAHREEEFVKRAGFVMMARLAVSDKKAKDEGFIGFFPIIKGGATDERNFVKKGVNWAIRQIGKRNLVLNGEAIALSEEIQKIDSRSARWIAADALRELKSDAVQSRLRGKK